ncbi:MAG: hypothetical protein HFE82_00480 [Erysipelotrichaceae bacterium]|nr:hypothetical protein [Erysipelotrichaceae bacterium]
MEVLGFVSFFLVIGLFTYFIILFSVRKAIIQAYYFIEADINSKHKKVKSNCSN